MADDEQNAKLKKIMEDGFGYPFHDPQSQELTGLNRSFEEAMAGVMDDIRDEMCGNCEYMCNDTHCGIRKTD
jgi:hypothetical protein